MVSKRVGYTDVLSGRRVERYSMRSMLPSICIESVDQNRMSCFSNDANVLAAERFPLISHEDRGVLLSPLVPLDDDDDDEST